MTRAEAGGANVVAVSEDPMAAYYRERAAEYDAFYQVNGFRDELHRLKAWLAKHVRGRTVLEVAAGTGYWTKVAAGAAATVTATDINPGVLAIAGKRRLGRNVVVQVADAYRLPEFASLFDVGMAHLWWSHLPNERQGAFLSQFVSRLQSRATLLMIDQNDVPGLGGLLFKWDRWGNRCELRPLDNGNVYEIVKNYPTDAELKSALARLCDSVQILRMRYFWALSARIRVGVR